MEEAAREAKNAVFSRNDPNHFNNMQFIYCIERRWLAASRLVKLIKGRYQNDTRRDSERWLLMSIILYRSDTRERGKRKREATR